MKLLLFATILCMAPYATAGGWFMISIGQPEAHADPKAHTANATCLAKVTALCLGGSPPRPAAGALASLLKARKLLKNGRMLPAQARRPAS